MEKDKWTVLQYIRHAAQEVCRNILKIENKIMDTMEKAIEAVNRPIDWTMAQKLATITTHSRETCATALAICQEHLDNRVTKDAPEVLIFKMLAMSHDAGMELETVATHYETLQYIIPVDLEVVGKYTRQYNELETKLNHPEYSRY